MSRDKICNKFLIHLIGERPALWDKTSSEYKDRSLRETCWREICVFVNPTFEDMNPDEKMEFTKIITKKWTHIRDSWVKSMKYGIDEKTKLPPKPYIYHEEVKFLQKVLRRYEFMVPNFDRWPEGNREHAHQPTGYNEYPHELVENMEYTMDTECNNETLNTIINQFKDSGDNDDGEKEIDLLGEDITKPAVENEKQANRLHHEDDHPNTKLTDMRPKKSPRTLAATQNTSMRHASYHCCDDRSPVIIADNNRHWNFFKGIFPSLNTLDDDHTLQFQAGVITLIQKLKATQKLPTKPLKRKRERDDDYVNKMNVGKRYATRAAKHSNDPIAVASDDEEEQNSDSDSNFEGDET